MVFHSCHSQDKKHIDCETIIGKSQNNSLYTSEVLDGLFEIKNGTYKDIGGTNHEKYSLLEIGIVNDKKNKSILSKNMRRYLLVFKLNNTQNLIDKDDYETTVDTDKKYQTILLYKYLKNGINKNNIKDISTVENIETVIGNYILQKDFYKPSFFERESKIIDNSISEEQLKIWLTCNEKVNFIDVVNENILFDDWNYPYKKITSMKDIADLYKYKNEEYGHTYKVDALPQQMALYMYFLPWKEREKVYKEIDALKKQLQKNKND